MKNPLTISLFAVALATLIGVTVWTSAAPAAPISAPATTSRAYLHAYNLPSSGVALEGYCPVAYFAVDKAVRGKPEYASTHNGVTYHFVSADAQKAFDANPQQYLPAFGGWCRFGMSVQDKFPVDPTNFKIVKGRLMVFLRNANIDAAALWTEGTESELIRAAEAHWAKVSQ